MGNGKAENLDILRKISGIRVPEFVVIRPEASEQQVEEEIINFLRTLPSNSTVAVRSSASQEDSADASFAGMYTTKLGVSATLAAVKEAVQEVRESGEQKQEVVSHYVHRRGIEMDSVGISVVVQKMIEADFSGVIFSHSLTKQDGYYVISVSNGVGETIVGGAANGRLIRIARGVKTESLKEGWLKQIVCAMRAIERYWQSSSLDVEFAVQHGTLYILQCRPITTIQTMGAIDAQEQELMGRIEELRVFVESCWSDDVLGDMIDVNPLELLGADPTPLDISIFRRLFTDRIVEKVRQDMGYDPLGLGLLSVVAGKPYVSMRTSAYSLRPCGISDKIYERIVRVYRDALIINPALQSRVEFDLFAMSCGEKLEQVMREAQLDDEDQRIVREAFGRLDSIFLEVSGSCADDFRAFVRDYERQTNALAAAPLETILDHAAKGTEMFVRVARLAFYWKNRFEEVHPQESLNDLIVGHLQSVNSQLQADLVACREGVITRDELVRRYGHLRPGQFSVFSEAYADDPDTYLFAQMKRAQTSEDKSRHLFEGTIEFQNVVTFMEARERMKFLFSKVLYLFSVELRRQLVQRSVSVPEASASTWEQLNGYLSKDQPAPKRDCSRELLPILLPEVILPGVTDLAVVTFPQAMPTYITQTVVKAPVCVIEEVGMKAEVRGAIVLLPNADPGYDFLFHSGAAAIITKVGGPASHMCIRAIEVQMPACIGCGEGTYQALMSARTAVLDCGSKQIIVQ